MKYVVIPNNIKEIEFYNEKGINAFIIGLEDYCINYPSFSLDEIKDLSNKYQLFIAVNKNIFNSECSDIKEKAQIGNILLAKGKRSGNDLIVNDLELLVI